MLRKLSIYQLYKIASYFLFSIFIIGFLAHYHGDQWSIFFLKGQATFSDFFNLSCFTADNNPYFNDVVIDRDKAYLPFSYLIIKLFSIGVDYNGMTPYGCIQSTGAMAQAVLFVLVSLGVYIYSLKKLGANNSFLILATISAPAIFQYERGNLIMLSAACLVCFLAFYNEIGYKKYIGLTLFCISMVLKVYPAIFGLLLLRDKRYKDILYCIGITSLLIILPFFYFEHGLDNFPVMLRNVSLNSEYFTTYTTTARYGIHAFVTLVFAKFHMIDTEMFNTSLLVSKIITLILCLLSIGMFFLEKTKWKQLAFLVFPLLMFPTASHFYCGLYLLPVLLLFLNENSDNKIDYLYVLMFIISFSPLQIVIKHTSISGHISCLAALAIWLILIVDTGIKYYRDRKISIAKSE